MSLDEKISQLASADPLTGAEEVPVVQGGVTKKTTVQALANKNDVAIQNNGVYVLEIDSADLSGTGAIKDQICAYILALPAGDRTILKTQSKWTVNLDNEAKVYEITGKGVGVITSLTASNLVQLNKGAGGGASAFTDLTDVPASYAGQAGKVLTVKSTEDGLKFTNPSTGAVGTLQEVTDNGAETTNAISFTDDLGGSTIIGPGLVQVSDSTSNQRMLVTPLLMGVNGISDSSKEIKFLFDVPTGSTLIRVMNEVGNPTMATREWTNAQGFENTANKGVANGYAPLDASAKIDASFLPDSILGQVTYKGVWDASTNSPAIPTASSSNKGWYYIVNVAGTTTIDGISDWQVGDWIISNGSVWSKVDNTDAISSFNGRTGAITLVTSDVTTALGFTPENATNKGTVLGNLASTTIYAHAKGVVDYVASLVASASVAGIAKLYNSLGSNTDGSVTQKLFTDSLSIIAETTTDGTVSSGSSNTVSSAILIEAGKVVAGNVVDVIGMVRATGSIGTRGVRLYVNTTPGLSGAPILVGALLNVANATLQIGIQRFLRVKVTNGAGAGTEIMNTSITNQGSDYGNYNSASQNVAIDWTVNQYIVLTVQATSAGDSLRSTFLKARR